MSQSGRGPGGQIGDESWYDVLCVSPDAPPQVVRAAYMQLAKLYHPDGISPDEERMKRLNAAWEVLGASSRRAVYDAERQFQEINRQRQRERERQEPTRRPHKPNDPTTEMFRPGPDSARSRRAGPDSTGRDGTDPFSRGFGGADGTQGWGEDDVPTGSADEGGTDGGGPSQGTGTTTGTPTSTGADGTVAGQDGVYQWPPAGGTGRQYAAVPVYRLRPLELPAVAASIVLALLGAASFNAAVKLLTQSRLQARLVGDLAAGLGADVATAELEQSASSVSSAVVMALVTGAVALVMFIAWQHRHAVNAELLIAQRYPLGPRWVFGGWALLLLCCFVPALSIAVAGFQMLRANQANERSNWPADIGAGNSPATGRGLLVLCGLLFAWSVQLLTLGAAPPPLPTDDPDAGALTDTALSGGAIDLDPAALSAESSASLTVTTWWALLCVASFLAIAMIRQLTQFQQAAVACREAA